MNTNPLTKYRDDNRVSQFELSIRTGVSRSTISHLETGRINPVSVRPRTWRQLAGAMKRDAVELQAELVTWYGHEQPNKVRHPISNDAYRELNCLELKVLARLEDGNWHLPARLIDTQLGYQRLQTSLQRLLGLKLVERAQIGEGSRHPRYQYRITEDGLSRKGEDNIENSGRLVSEVCDGPQKLDHQEG